MMTSKSHYSDSFYPSLEEIGNMKLIKLCESTDDTKNVEIQTKLQNFYFTTRTGLKCHANFNWPNPIGLGLINVVGVIELTDGVIPSNLFGDVMLGAVDFIKTLDIDSSDIDELEIRISTLFVTYMGLEIKMNDILLQQEKIQYSKRFKLIDLINTENEEIYGNEILREFPKFADNLNGMVDNLKIKTKNIYRSMKKGKVKEFQYELPDNPKIEIKLSMDNVRKESTIITPNLKPYVTIDKNDVNILNKPEDISDASLNLSFFHELGLKFRKFKIILMISE